MIILYKDNMVSQKYEISEDNFKEKFDKYVALEKIENYPLLRQVLLFVAIVLRSSYDNTELDKMLKAVK